MTLSKQRRYLCRTVATRCLLLLEPHHGYPHIPYQRCSRETIYATCSPPAPNNRRMGGHTSYAENDGSIQVVIGADA